ncbi:hypothetical protein FJ651_11015 [Paucihalobacter ruber]|uniref:Uncharacterized protein n=1 Tax=Paucihalobacter ruber TaxID=2567861 RepID=A0A506PG52_9FLAO|nr:DUF6090 family protein [Paucihalobacter ruber]TPV32833.1 hypothetical protein FJ651_11015 [Paucihalobacter ruber]
MIKFFRKIRQKMIEESKVRKPASPAGKYLLYAIGEIVLVVIGILIALQINTWKETQKLRSIELETLTEIQQALIQDTIVLNANILVLKEKEQKAKALIHHIELKQPYSQDLDRLMMTVYYHRGYKTFNTAAFELLKERGFGIVKNPELRKAITNHYTTDLADINNILNRVESLNLLQAENIFKNFKIYGDGKSGYIRAYDYDALLENPKIFGPFYHFELIITTYQGNLSTFKSKTEQILNAVTTELEQRKD